MNALLFAAVLATANVPVAMGESVSDFKLDDFRGKTHALSDYQDRSIVVIAFLGTECPLAKLYGPRLQEMSERYADRGVQFLGVNSNTQDTLAEISAYARKHQIDFPLLKDAGNRVADQLRAKRTPEVFVLDQDRSLRYWGRIDDQFGVGYVRDEPTEFPLRDAIDQLLEGREVEQPVAESVGCYIGRVREKVADSEVTYSNQIARILQKNCVECHRDGEIAPFALNDYDSASAWADTIVEVVKDQRMPPWHANPEFGEFVNSRLMSEEEKKQLFDWAAAGAPEGDPAQQPEPLTFTDGWRLPRQPDQVVGMSSTPFEVAAEDTVDYQYFVVDPGFKEDKWVSAAEVIPGNRSVVHHAIVFIRPPGSIQKNGIGSWLSAYVPGQMSTALPPGQAMLIPAGSKFIFQMHYTPIGSAQQDLTKVGLVFADPAEVTHRALTLISINRKFEIPPHDPNFQANAWLENVPENATLHAIAPHMHLRGKSFRFVLHQDGEQKVLLDVPKYDFNWQHSYQFSEPLEIRDGMRIECVAHFDNSEGNPVNPDPSQPVRWGDQTWEEMVVAYFGVTIPRDDQKIEIRQEGQRDQTQNLQDAERNARRIMKRFDKNEDGMLSRNEVPKAMAVFAFSRFDADGDDRISFEEAREYALRSNKSTDE